MGKKQRIFIDIDGVMAKWMNVSIEEAALPGYCKYLPQQSPVIWAIKKLIESEEFEIFSLSAAFNDNHSKEDKNEWLDNNIPQIDKEHRIFTIYGEKKSDSIPEKTRSDILLDDFSRNLFEWHGVGVKLLNGINDTRKTWGGYRISIYSRCDIIYRTLRAIALTEREETF